MNNLPERHARKREVEDQARIETSPMESDTVTSPMELSTETSPMESRTVTSPMELSTEASPMELKTETGPFQDPETQAPDMTGAIPQQGLADERMCDTGTALDPSWVGLAETDARLRMSKCYRLLLNLAPKHGSEKPKKVSPLHRA